MSKLQKRGLRAEIVIFFSLGSLIWQLADFIVYRKVENGASLLVNNPNYHVNIVWLCLSLSALFWSSITRVINESPYGNRHKGTTFGQRMVHLRGTLSWMAFFTSIIMVLVWLYGSTSLKTPSGSTPWIWSIWALLPLGWLLLITAFSWSIYRQLPDGQTPPLSAEEVYKDLSDHELEMFAHQLWFENGQLDAKVTSTVEDNDPALLAMNINDGLIETVLSELLRREAVTEARFDNLVFINNCLTSRKITKL